MATLVLTSVGTVLGGPVGGAIGAILGQQVDNALFAPRRGTGPGWATLRYRHRPTGLPSRSCSGRCGSLAP